MAIAVRGSNAAGNSSGGSTSISVAKPNGTVNGDYLLAIHGAYHTASLADMSGPVTLAALSSRDTGGSATAKSELYDGAAGSETAYGFTSPRHVGLVAAFSGHDLARPVDIAPVWNHSDSDTLSHVAPSVTPTVDGGFLLCGYITSDVSSLAPSHLTPLGMTLVHSFGVVSGSNQRVTVALFSEQLGAAGTATGTRTSTVAVAAPFIAFSMILAPQPGAAGPPPGAFLPFFS